MFEKQQHDGCLNVFALSCIRDAKPKPAETSQLWSCCKREVDIVLSPQYAAMTLPHQLQRILTLRI
jgi:hypothetical protein